MGNERRGCREMKEREEREAEEDKERRTVKIKDKLMRRRMRDGETASIQLVVQSKED